MSDAHSIKVYLRCRPLRKIEQESAIVCDDCSNEVVYEPLGKKFNFDRVFTQDATQEEIYRTIVNPLIKFILNGSNCTVFAYGPTGTGKTHTMEGVSKEEPGIIPRAVAQIFESVQTRSGRFKVQVSFLELYNEDVYDLLSDVDDTSKLRIYDDTQRKNSVRIEGLNERTVETAGEIFNILTQGSTKRQKAATLLNAHSSRSHSIFSISILACETDDEDFRKLGKLNLVDLAGSENIGRSGAQNKNAREAGNINQSLLTLTRVITALVEKRPHIPYRESKLTRILQDSLGGSTRTAMIATLSLAEADISHTLSTLDYASRARYITNHTEHNSRILKSTSLRDFEQEKLARARELLDMEMKIRNEVAEDYKREIERKDEQQECRIARLQEQCRNEIERIREQCRIEIERIQEQSRIEIERMQEQCQNEVKSKNKSLEEKLLENETENTNLKEQLKDRNQKLERIEEQLDQFRNEVERCKQEEKLNNKLFEDQTQKLLERDTEIANLKEQLKTAPICTPEKKQPVKRVPKQAPINEDDYANLTFDYDDEIVQCSAKKKHRPLVGYSKALTLSGKKKNLPAGNEVEISPPVRVTRSRATRRDIERKRAKTANRDLLE